MSISKISNTQKTEYTAVVVATSGTMPGNSTNFEYHFFSKQGTFYSPGIPIVLTTNVSFLPAVYSGATSSYTPYFPSELQKSKDLFFNTYGAEGTYDGTSGLYYLTTSQTEFFIVARATWRGNTIWASTGDITDLASTSLIYANNRYMVSWTESSLLRISTNLTNWASTTTSAQVPTVANIRYVNNTWFALGGLAGSGPWLSSSTDGLTWTTRTTATTSAVQMRRLLDIAYGNNRYIAVGNTGGGTPNIWWSTDGTTWTTRATIYGSYTSNWALRNVVYSTTGGFMISGVLVSTGGGGAPQSSVWTSTDGVTWTTRTTGITVVSKGGIASLTYLNDRYIAISSYLAEVASSTDGITWTIHGTLPIASFSQIYNDWIDGNAIRTFPSKIAFNNGLYCAVDGNGFIRFSTNLSQWSTKKGALYEGNNRTNQNQVIYGNNAWVADYHMFANAATPIQGVLEAKSHVVWTSTDAWSGVAVLPNPAVVSIEKKTSVLDDIIIS